MPTDTPTPRPSDWMERVEAALAEAVAYLPPDDLRDSGVRVRLLDALAAIRIARRAAMPEVEAEPVAWEVNGPDFMSTFMRREDADWMASLMRGSVINPLYRLKTPPPTETTPEPKEAL